MESKDILQILMNLNRDDVYKKIFINGAWGIGKSFYTNQYIEANSKTTVYISLFGKIDIKNIEDSIARELFKKINFDKKIKNGSLEILGVLKSAISYRGVSISIPGIDIKSSIEKAQEFLKDEKLMIVIDDLERKSPKLLISDILGIIESISLLSSTKVVLIGDESKLNTDDLSNWSNFKEKIIEKEYLISNFSNEAVEALVIKRLNKYIEEKEIKNFIDTFFSNYKIKNLRTVNKGINLFLEIVQNHLECQYNKDINLIILKNCMAVVVESIEKFFPPKEEYKNSSDTQKKWEYVNDSILSNRIMRHYFMSDAMAVKEAILIEEIIKIFNGDYCLV